MILETLSKLVWSLPMIILMILTGGYFTFGSGWFQLRRFGEICRETLGSLFRGKKKGDGISPFKAMSTALAGTAGTGNIVGVATALTAGGPGAVFWMWVSALFGMMTKFAEVALAVKYRKKNESGTYSGGPMYTIIHGLGEKYLPLSYIFSVLCVFASFGIGNMTQINSISVSLREVFGVSALITGIIVAILILLVVAGGVKRISNFAGFLVPFMSILYIAGTVIIIICNYKSLPGAVSSIFKGALSFGSAAGGVLGYTVGQAMRMGVARGIFTNEAGLGSAPIAHAAADTTPRIQGMWGAFEVFFDTMVVCTLTAFAILSSRIYYTGTADGAELTNAVFREIFGNAAPVMLAAAITLFAFASMLGWCYYGEECCKFIFRKHPRRAVFFYRLIFAAAAVLGAVLQVRAVWNLSDILNGLMIFPNLISILLLSGRVFEITKTNPSGRGPRPRILPD